MEGIVLFILFAFCICVIIAMFREKKKTKKDEWEEKERLGYVQKGAFFHFSGLPMAEKISCIVYYFEDKISITGAGQTFNLSLDKVIDLAIASNVEIQKAYVSSVGGAVGGAVLFGPIGAMIGGRTKEKKTMNITYYFIITYQKDDTTAYIAFQPMSKTSDATNMIKYFKQRPKQEIAPVEL